MSPAGLANVCCGVTSFPHDALVRSIFGQPRHAAAELRAVLPAPIVAELDLRTLAPLDGSFVDDELRASCADLLFKVELRRGRRLVYVLFEHQRKPDRRMPSRLLHYLHQIWTRHAARHPSDRELPPIVPVVIYNGSRPWPWPRDFAGALGLPAPLRATFGRRLLDFEFALDDLARVTDRQLLARAMDAVARIALVALRNAGVEPRLATHVAAVMKTLHRDLRGPGVVAALAQIVSYVLEVGKERPRDVRRILAAALPPSYRSSVMTTADMLRAEGHTEGRTEGLLEARRESLLEMLAVRFGPLTASTRRRIKAAPSEQLIPWLRRGAVAQRLAEVFSA